MATSSSKQSLEIAGPRNMDELEGALLPPTAIPIDESQQQQQQVDASVAVPVEAFLYTEESAAVSTAEAEIPIAPFLPLDQDNREDKEKQAIAKAKRKGKIMSESEKEAIGKASREHYAKSYHAKQKVEVANDEARRRNREGVQVKEDKYTVERDGPTASSVEKKEGEYAFPSSYQGGYKMAEYDVQEYDTNDDYQVSEYKSVYDP